ncbi:hypothetical protein EQ500_09015 [Lactobacillus sp. XV13L]|nr:hypothetical protein [Lactobacillus sp. XV13L]
MRQMPIYLISKNKSQSSDPLNDEKEFNFQKIYNARVTELNGAQSQINALGKAYDHSWVIRLAGLYNADYVGFIGDFDEIKMKPRFQISQIRRHKDRTDIYVIKTEVNANGS